MTAENKKKFIDRILVPLLSGLLSCSVALGVVFTTGMMEYAVDQNEQEQLKRSVSALQDVTNTHSREISGLQTTTGTIESDIQWLKEWAQRMEARAWEGKGGG